MAVEVKPELDQGIPEAVKLELLQMAADHLSAMWASKRTFCPEYEFESFCTVLMTAWNKGLDFTPEQQPPQPTAPGEQPPQQKPRRSSCLPEGHTIMRRGEQFLEIEKRVIDLEASRADVGLELAQMMIADGYAGMAGETLQTFTRSSASRILREYMYKLGVRRLDDLPDDKMWQL